MPGYTDRRSAMIAFGIIELMIGLVWVLPLVALMVRPADAPPGSAATMLFVFGGVASASIALGIGTLLARRWARTLSLLMAWGWLLVGLAILTFSLFLPHMPAGILGVFVFVTLLATIFIFFYSGENVKATFEARDPNVRWTDRCPAPVLALSLTYAISALGVIMNLNRGIPTALFGVVLTGSNSTAYYAIQGALSVYLAWGAYRLSRTAWRVSLAVTIVMAASVFVTYATTDLTALYQSMNVPPGDLATLQTLGMKRILQLTAIMPLVWVAYLLYVKRYFDAAISGSHT